MANGRYDLVVEEDGAPALVLAGATVIDPDTKSGNPAHEIGSGRFGRGRSQVERRKSDRRRVAPSTTPEEQADAARSVERRRDAIVDAARTLTDLSPAGVSTFVRRRWAGTRVLEQEDIDQFAADAHRQRIEDVIDALDGRIRKGVYGRSSKTVKVDFPRGMVRQTLRGLDQDEVNKVLRRLRERGWSSDQVRTHVVRPFDDKAKRFAAELGALS